MVYKLIKNMPKHEIGDIIFLSESANNLFYEWVESPNYLLPIDIIDEEFFEKIDIGWNIGDKIYYINMYDMIVENIFDLKSHIKLVLSDNIFRCREDAQWFLDMKNKLKNSEIIISDREVFLDIIDKLKNKNVEKVLDILEKMI